jgi:ribosomal protein S18 acetylase RimI-like enzyme
MPLTFRLAVPSDYAKVETLVIDAFEPITWFKKADARWGPLNGKEWRQRWQLRFAAAFKTQIVLVGEAEGEIAAVATGTIDLDTRLGFIDLLAVDRRFQGRGYGREMLRGMLRHMKEQGAVHAHLDCLVDNEAANSLYRSEGFEEAARSIRWFVKIE